MAVSQIGRIPPRSASSPSSAPASPAMRHLPASHGRPPWQPVVHGCTRRCNRIGRIPLVTLRPAGGPPRVTQDAWWGRDVRPAAALLTPATNRRLSRDRGAGDHRVDLRCGNHQRRRRPCTSKVPPRLGLRTVQRHRYTVGLTGVTNQQYVTVALTNVASSDVRHRRSGPCGSGSCSATVNQNRVVTVADLRLVNTWCAQVSDGRDLSR